MGSLTKRQDVGPGKFLAFQESSGYYRGVKKQDGVTDQGSGRLPHFVSEREAAGTIGISVKLLQHDRMRPDPRFPFYRVGVKRIVYDRNELLSLVLATRNCGQGVMKKDSEGACKSMRGVLI
jgi:hypothetical protein